MSEKELDQLEATALRDSYVRVSKAVEGLPKTPEEVSIENSEGGIDVGMRIPCVKVRAGDTYRIAMAIPPDQKTGIVRALLKGTDPKLVPPDLVVQQQCTCLHHLLSIAAKYIPAGVDDGDSDGPTQ